jgi:hypothetical protein
LSQRRWWGCRHRLAPAGSGKGKENGQETLVPASCASRRLRWRRACVKSGRESRDSAAARPKDSPGHSSPDAASQPAGGRAVRAPPTALRGWEARPQRAKVCCISVLLIAVRHAASSAPEHRRKNPRCHLRLILCSTVAPGLRPVVATGTPSAPASRGLSFPPQLRQIVAGTTLAQAQTTRRGHQPDLHQEGDQRSRKRAAARRRSSRKSPSGLYLDDTIFITLFRAIDNCVTQAAPIAPIPEGRPWWQIKVTFSAHMKRNASGR